MNERYRAMAIAVNPSSEKFYTEDWEYNCAAWTGEEIEQLADLIIGEVVAVAVSHCLESKSVKTQQVKLEVVQAIKDHFELEHNSEQ